MSAAPAAAPTTAPTAASTAPSTASTTDATPLVIGYTQAPGTLYGLASSDSVAGNVLQFIQPGCISLLDYAQQAVCFETLPSFENGGIVSRTVTVAPSDVGEASPIVLNGELVTDGSTLTRTLQLPQLAVQWRLQQGMAWEDGRALTADDIIFTWELANHPDTPVASRWVLDRTRGIKQIDRYTVEWQGVPGYVDAGVAANFAGGGDSLYAIYPRHILGDVVPSEVDSVWGSRPMSYGPFKIEAYTPGEQIMLVKNPYYWRASEGLPRTEKVIIKFVSGTDQLWQQLSTGEIDIAGTVGFTAADVPRLDELAANGTIRTQYVSGSVWEHLDFAVARGDDQPSFFNDVRVRQAVAYAINRKQIVDEVLHGHSALMHTFDPPDYWAYPPAGSLNEYAHDPERAKQLLDEAGWRLSSDGVRARDDVPFVLQLYTTEKDRTRTLVAQIIQANLKKVGISVELQFVSSDLLFDVSESGILSGRRFDLALYAWQAGIETSASLYTCDAVPGPANSYGGLNSTGYCNTAFDQLVRQSVALPERAERTPLIVQAQTLFNQELPAIPLYQQLLVVAYNTRVEGVAINASSLVDFFAPELLFQQGVEGA